MGIFDSCLLAADIDSTLIDGEYLNPENVEKIDFFISEGGMFSLSTGRTIGAVNPILRKLNRISPSVLANGGMIYDFENKNILYEVTLTELDCEFVKAVLELDLNIGVEVHSGPEVFTLKRTSETDDHQIYEEVEIKEISLEEALKYKWNKAFYTFENQAERKALEDLMYSLKTDSAFFNTGTVIYGRKRSYYEQIPSGLSKALTLKRLAQMFNIKQGGIFAIGDYYNDIEMLKAADISAAPLNAIDEVKECSQYIARTARDGAVADFIDYLTNVLQNKK